MESHDEENVDWNDTFLPEVSFGPENKDPLYLYSDLFSICHRGVGKVWYMEGFVSGSEKNFTMQSFCKGRI